MPDVVARTGLVIAVPEAERLVGPHRLRLDATAIPAFGFRICRTAWFDDRVLYLASDDERPFRELTARIHAESPGFPPFGGAFDDVVPHLTVGHEQPLDVLRRAEADIVPRLPLEGRATEVLLLAQDEPGGRWRERASFPLSRR